MTGIRDLARHLDLSIGTVSRALNDKADVNPRTRDRVREAARQLGYSPNQSGRSLRRGKTDLVGVIVPIGSDSALINAVFLSVLDGLRRQLAENRLDLAIFLHGQDEELFGSLRRLTERGLVDGLIIANTLRVDPRIDYLLAMRRPFVAFGRSLSGGSHPWVDPDFEAAVEGAIERLANLGHRRIALLLPPGETNFLHVIAKTYREALRRRGLELAPGHALRWHASESGGSEAGEALLATSPAPTAILVSEARQAIGLFRKLEERGLRPGRDISVVGLLPEERALGLTPALTAFVTDWTEVGARLGAALIGAQTPGARVVQAIVPAIFRPGATLHRVMEASSACRAR